MTDPIIIYEWDKKPLSEIAGGKEEEFSKKLKEYKQKSATSRAVIGYFDKRNIEVAEDCLRNNGNNVGIVKLDGEFSQIEFRPKLDNPKYSKEETASLFWNFLPRMLHTLENFDDFKKNIFIDPNQSVRLPKGFNFVFLFALSFVSLCAKAIKNGMLKKYVPKYERLKSIKGKINFSQLARSKSWDLSSLPCTYFDLTFDNAENQIILWCLYKLLRETRKIMGNNGSNGFFVLRKLREQLVLLSEEILLVPKSRADILSINFAGLPPYYLDLMNLCRAILTEKLFSFEEKDQYNVGTNFIIDMDWVFEQYMTHLFQIVIAENENYWKTFQAKSQSVQTLADRNNLKIKPDLVIYKLGKSGGQPKVVAVVDYKWKVSGAVKNADFYQVICYGLAHLQIGLLDKIEAALFSIADKSDGNFIFDFDRISKVFEGKKEIAILKLDLDPALMAKNEAEQIENGIKQKISQYFNRLLKNDRLSVDSPG